MIAFQLHHCNRSIVAIYPIFIAVGLQQDCNKILLHFYYILVAVGLRWDCTKKKITFQLHFHYVFITFILQHCNQNVIKMQCNKKLI